MSPFAEATGNWLLQIGAICGAVVVIITAGTFIVRLPPIRWLWRQLIGSPIERFWTRVIAEGAAKFHREVVEPQIAAIQHDVTELVAQGETSWHKDKAWMVSRVTLLEARYNYIRDRQHALTRGIMDALTSGRTVEDIRAQIIVVLDTPVPNEPNKEAN